MVKVVHGWHTDADLLHSTAVSVGNRVEGMGQDFVNENTEMVQNRLRNATSDPDDYEGGNKTTAG